MVEICWRAASHEMSFTLPESNFWTQNLEIALKPYVTFGQPRQ
jgi:hypothetical protein